MLKSTIPYIDLRGKGENALLRAFPDKAKAMLYASRKTYGLASYAASAAVFPLSDLWSRHLLRISHSPYLHEIEEAAHIVGKAGIYTLNIADCWGCTSGAYVTAGGVEILRVLDWPFPEMGKHIIVALQENAAGIYYNITWPAVSGIFQALAPGRFAAAINLAPMRKHGLGKVGDWLANRFIIGKEGALPPSHLLRQVFEQARNYHEAKRLLAETIISTPVIFTLVGINPAEGCIIERLENAAEIHELGAESAVSASNQFRDSRDSKIAATNKKIWHKKGWRPREIDSAGRYRQSCEIDLRETAQEKLDWLQPPILNLNTRLAMQADAAAGSLYVQGYEGLAAVTNPFVITANSK